MAPLTSFSCPVPLLSSPDLLPAPIPPLHLPSAPFSLPPALLDSSHPSCPSPDTSAGHIAPEGWELEQFVFGALQSSIIEDALNPDDAGFILDLMECNVERDPTEPLQANDFTLRDNALAWEFEEEDGGTEQSIPCEKPLANFDLGAKPKKGQVDDLAAVVHSTSGSEASESEDVTVKFPHHLDVTIEGFSAVAAEDRQVLMIPAEEELDDEAAKASERQTMNLKLLHLLLACAEAVAEENLDLARVLLCRLQELSFEYGSPLQRLAVYFTEALAAHIVPNAAQDFIRGLKAALPQCDMLEAFSVFYNVNPIGKFCHLTLNQVILDTIVTDTQVHVVDLHIGYGMQWAAFLQAVALRPNGPPKLRLTAIGPSGETLNSTGNKLMDMAKSLQVPFEYCPLVVLLENFDVQMLDLREEEVCVISSLGQLHTMLHKGEDYVDRFLQTLKSSQPKVFVFAENDADHNQPSFLNRFVDCLKYYAAVFDALDAALPSNSQARLKMERLLAGRKIGSIIACEGFDRVERHERMTRWMKRMVEAGYEEVELGYSAVNQANLLLKLYYPNGYSLTDDSGALTLRWNGMALIGVAVFR